MCKQVRLSNVDSSELEIQYVTEAVKSGWISSSGSFVQKAQEKWADFCGVKYCLLVSSGTAALHLSLMPFNLQPDDEVIVPGMTFVSPVAVVKRIGARPVIADVDKMTWCIDPESIKGLITKKTKGIIAVNILGYPANYDAIRKICNNFNLFLIEDAAQSHASNYKGKRCGSFGDVSIFSFFANKTITSGEGGAVLTSDRDIYDKMKVIMNHGMTKNKPYWHGIVGDNFRITNLSAAFLCAQIERIDSIIRKRKHISKLYRDLLSGVGDIEFRKKSEDIDIVVWLQTILVRKRDELVKFLISKNIDARSLWFPIINLPPYCYNQKDTPVAREILSRALWLPTYSSMADSDIEYVVNNVKKFFVPVSQIK